MVSGNRLFISPGAFLKHVAGAGAPEAIRAADVALNESEQETDSIFFDVPRGYLPEGDLPAGR